MAEADISSADGLPYLTSLPHVSPADAKVRAICSPLSRSSCITCVKVMQAELATCGVDLELRLLRPRDVSGGAEGGVVLSTRRTKRKDSVRDAAKRRHYGGTCVGHHVSLVGSRVMEQGKGQVGVP